MYDHVESTSRRKMPYASLDDDRFEWLLNVFLVYLENWRKSTLELEEINLGEGEELLG